MFDTTAGDDHLPGPADAGADGRADDPLAAVEQATATLRSATRGDLDGLGPDGHRRLLARIRDLKAATCALEADTITAAERAGTPEADGAASTTAWVKRHLNTSGRTAKQAEALAGGLDRLPDTAQALADGHITDQHAGHLARAADRGWLGDPDRVEDVLLDDAKQLDPDRFRRLVRRREQATDDALAADEHTAHAKRETTIRHDGDGTSLLRARLPTPQMETVETALDALESPDPADTPDELARTPRQRRADALVDLARTVLELGELPDQGSVKPHVSVTVPIETLQAETGGPAGQAAYSGPISAQAARRIACDASVSRVITSGDSQILDVGRATRTWNPAQRRAVVARDGHCRFGDCDRFSFWCVIHHVRFWEHGGPSDLDNAVLLCWWHHHAVHDLNWNLEFEPDTGTVTVTSPYDDTRLVSRPEGFSNLQPTLPGADPPGSGPPRPAG